MLFELILYTLFFLANGTAALSFSAFAWLEIDAYRTDKNTHNLTRGIGLGVLSLSFLTNLLGSAELLILLSAVGLAFTYFGFANEFIPTKPPKRILAVHPFLIIPGIGNVVLSLMIHSKIERKVKIGLSKEFAGQVIIWKLITMFFGIILLQVLGENFLTWLDILTRRGGVVWILGNVTLLIAGLLLFRWIIKFLSFRVFANLFFSIWTLILFTAAILSVFYSFFTIRQSEEQLYSLLKQNNQLTQLNIEQISENNENAIFSIKNSNVNELTENRDLVALKSVLNEIKNSNSTIDNIQVLDTQGILIYDLNSPEINLKSFSNNKVVSSLQNGNDRESGFNVVNNEPSGSIVSFQTGARLETSNGELAGIALITKYFDDNYLDVIKSKTSMEFLVYVDGKRSAGTILQSDGKSRVENLSEPQYTNLLFSENGVDFYTADIVNTKYYISVSKFLDIENNVVGKFIAATPQVLVTQTLENALRNTFMVTFLLCLLAVAPSYYMARNLKK